MLGVLPVLGACAGHQGGYALPAGLTYRCAGQPAMVVYNGQGYLPGNSVRTPYATAAGQEPMQAPRSTARLWYGGRQYQMMADYAETGLRYRSVEPVSDTHALIWTADGESAWVGEIPVVRGAAERRLAECTRIRAVGPADRTSDSGHGAAHAEPGPTPAGEPHG